MSDNSDTKKNKPDIWLILHSISGMFRMGIQLVVMMIFLPIIIGYVGEEKYGVWSLAMAIAGVLAFLEFGLVQATNRFMSEIDYKINQEELQQLACTTFWLTVLSAALVLAIGLPFPELIASLLGVPDKIVGEAGFLIFLMIWRLALSIPLRNFNTVLISQRLMVRAHLAQGFLTAIYFITGWIALEMGYGLKGLGMAYLFSMVAEHIVYMFMARIVIPLSAYLPRNFRKDLVGKIFEFSIFAFLGQVVNVIFTRGNILIVQAVSGLVATGAYGVATRLANISLDLSSQTVYAGGPKVAKLAAESEEGKTEAGWISLMLARRAMLFCAPLAAVAIPLGGIFLRGWIGGEMAVLATVPLAILSLDSALRMPILTASNSLALTGQHRWINTMSFLFSMLYLPLAFLNGYLWGAVGVAATSLVLNMLVGVPIYLTKASKHLNLRFHYWWRDVYAHHVWPFLICLGVAYAFRLLCLAYIPEGRAWILAGASFGFISAMIYATIYIMVTAPEDEKKLLLDKIKSKLKRN